MSSERIAKQVSLILSKVRKEGDRALEFYAQKFDGVKLPAKRFEIPKKALKDACSRITPQLKQSILISRSRVERFHREEMKRLSKNWAVPIDGIRVGQTASAILSAGIYVPGGRFSYPSTVIMTAIPAKVAGVKNIVMVTPPGKAQDAVLAAAYLCGVDRCFTVGGPAAVAALAYGTRTIPAVDKIVGPGNLYVTEAKRQVFGVVGIDGLAGPSEVAIMADASSDVRTVVLNLLAQAEHDPAARSFLISGDREFLARVRKEIPKAFLPQIELSFEKNIKKAAEKINEIAAEHLVLAVKRPEKILPWIRNAGAIFIGADTPVPLGDYTAGPSHVLPTGGAARFSSGLSVKDFLKWSSTIKRENGGSKAVGAAKILAQSEGLAYHALSLE